MKTTYANQKSITINRTMPQKGSGRKFLSAYYDSITAASRILTGEVAFKLYLYLLSNQDKYTDSFSPQNFSNDFGVSTDRTRKVFEQLEEAGYLIKTDSNEYQFYEVPQKKLSFTNKMKIERRYIENEDGSFEKMTYIEFYEAAKQQMNWPDIVIQENWKESKIVEEN